MQYIFKLKICLHFFTLRLGWISMGSLVTLALHLVRNGVAWCREATRGDTISNEKRTSRSFF